MFKNHLSLYGRTFPNRPWWQSVGGDVMGNRFLRSDARFLLDLGWQTYSKLTLTRRVVQGEDTSVLEGFKPDYSFNNFSNVGAEANVSDWPYDMIGVHAVSDRPKLMQVALDEIDAIDKKWPVPRPPMQAGQVWATSGGSQHLVLSQDSTGREVGVFVEGRLVRFDSTTGLALDSMPLGMRRRLDPATTVPDIPGIPLDSSPEEVRAFVADVQGILVLNTEPVFVALLHGPSPWGRDVPWCDTNKVPSL